MQRIVLLPSVRNWCNKWCNKNMSVRLSARNALFLFAAVTSGSSWAGEIKVFAAASLTDAITELSASYQKMHPEVTIKKSFASSSALAKQIENGAQADIFISADQDWADYLQKRGLLETKSRKNLLGNQLVLIAPAGKVFKVVFDKSFNLAGAFTGRWCTGDPSFVPVGKYTQQAFSTYNWWDAMASRLVSTEDVRTALAFVERGECALGVVYKTDGLLSKKVSEIALLPADSHKPIEYPGALLPHAGTDAAIFWDYLQSPEAKALYIKLGFTPLF